MAPKDRQVSIYDSYSNCENECNSGPLSSHYRRKLNRVSFHPTVDLKEIANRNDYTPTEVHACWYSAEEKELMYESCETVVDRMEAGKRPKKNTSYRGLENFIEANASQFDDTIHAYIDAVMDEQERQWDNDMFDCELLREVALEVSLYSASLAHKMAAYDVNEARKAYISMGKAHRKLQDDVSISTEITEVSRSTMVHDIKAKHNKTKRDDPSAGSSKKSRTEKKRSSSRPPKSHSSGSPKAIGGPLESFRNKVYNTKTGERRF
ncbi:unnamed protein product [Cylindrotheca closterium]|uniref:Uncharacterized protein n=1 Tax=Cylindrotheca closterium TaxID=2856 RepID=A0AAD2FM87_9STRA|nr:unnamed protein product [Cylindrotheca closterium]